MQTINDANTLAAALAGFRAQGERVALVPTMGALHAGHLSLITLAKGHATRVVVSIFVNPKQFGPNEDFDAYPRVLARDAVLLEAADVDLLWAPTVAEMYPQGFATTVSVAGLGDHLCGAARPGHFDGVATVVTKLLAQVRPDVAIFGEKDWQQLAIIRRLTADLTLGAQIIGGPIVREADGLAMSSRNAYLSAQEREIAAQLPVLLARAAEEVVNGMRVDAALTQTRAALLEAGFAKVDYLELIDGESLKLLQESSASARLVAAVYCGHTRLIDNIPLGFE